MNSLTNTIEAVPPQSPTPAAPLPELAITVIQAKQGWAAFRLAELWRFRELLYYLTWRDIKVRYKQTVLGVAWAFIQPLATMLVFALCIGRMGGVANQIEHYSLFVFAGILPWTFFSNAISTAGMSVIQNQNLVTKVYFPRLLVPISSVGSALFDFLVSITLLVVLMLVYQVTPGITLLLAPVIMGLLIASALGIGILLAALIVAQRDFKYVLNFAVQLWMLATPCIYLPSESIGSLSQWLMPLNPVYGLILNFRQCVLNGPLDWYALVVSGGISLMLFLFGSAYFRRVEKGFADII
ncbi:ABC transporter permease [Telmatocola sphagniphila]|uniref:Transport permease protein n=1 Tax=Telmatocola sphagniphila TaxID=1123043 RepID=A0A8E6EUE3_9BACT|nr:ABC transporter permease [Telmatocola sphagniphila]QVL31147.1 ABC transporter permease [Telmatocola sphagniphila]